MNPSRYSAILPSMELQDEPIAYAKWDSSNLSASFKLFAEFIHGNARKYLLEDMRHDELIFFMPQDGKGSLVTVQTTGTDRDALAQSVRDYIRKHGIFGIVHVCESWVKFADTPHDPAVPQIQFAEIKVSAVKPDHRTEVLSVSAQSRDGFSINWMDEMLRHKKKGTLKLGPCHEFTGYDGRFGELFG